ncbi:hypothetical protein [Thalassobius sp. MITS945101]|uniref:hypothetical protein n=1 Tax=Thalassobius sp. MITS945101 TaxID=3096994 RepID=UPI00399B89A8
MDYPEQETLTISADKLGFATPTSMIFLTKVCRQRAKKHRNETRKFFGLSKHDYANNLGFSKALNLKGNPFQQGAFGGNNYIPISLMQKDVLEEAAADKFIHLGDEIEQRCGSLAKVVSQGKGRELERALQISFREIIRNSFEHGETNEVTFCAQHWPQREQVEICIADKGIGVRASLESGKYNIPKNDQDALKYSIMPGVSSKAWRNKKKRASQKSEWDNAGYGLFFAHHLFGNLGHFFIGSGDSGLLLSKDKKMELPCKIEGTLVSLNLDLSCEGSILEALNGISKQSHKIKTRLGVKSLDLAEIDSYLKANKLE